MRQTAGEPLIIYPRSPRPSYADQVLGFYRDVGVEPLIGMEAKELQTALGLVAAGGGICVVPNSVRRLGRDDIKYIELDEPGLTTPIIMSQRRNDASLILKQLSALVSDFES